MSVEDFIKQQLGESAAVKQALLADVAQVATIAALVERCVAALRAGHKILLAGNGGSAADAQHIAAELVGRFGFDRPALAAFALTTDTSLLTAVANDYGYDAVFRRQLQGVGRRGDVFIGLSTSGNSASILDALDACADLGIDRVGFTGASGGEMADRCDFCIRIPSTDTARVQEAHITVGHILCAQIEQSLFA